MTLMELIRKYRPEEYTILITQGLEIYRSDDGLRIKDVSGKVNFELEPLLDKARAD